MDVSHEAPDATTKPKCYDLTNILVQSDTTHISFTLRNHLAILLNLRERPTLRNHLTILPVSFSFENSNFHFQHFKVSMTFTLNPEIYHSILNKYINQFKLQQIERIAVLTLLIPQRFTNG